MEIYPARDRAVGFGADASQCADRSPAVQILHAKQKLSTEDLICGFYVRGFIDGLMIGMSAQRLGPVICPPNEGISADQGRLIAEKYLRDHPEELHLEAGLELGKAFTIAFPCPGN